jgi:hypothetical protein
MAESKLLESEFPLESDKGEPRHFFIERCSVTVANQPLIVLMKSNCKIPVADRSWVHSLPEKHIFSEYGSDWVVLSISIGSNLTQIRFLLADIQNRIGYTMVIPWYWHTNSEVIG